ncbi:hypothetical protein ZWY2020_027917, partial [Hordeum vulgare]
SANRASQERLTPLIKGFSEDQTKVDGDGDACIDGCLMPKLVNRVCDWLGDIYNPVSRQFDSIFCTLGVPRGKLKVPYDVNSEIEEVLFPQLFPGEASIPNKTVLANLLEGMKTSSEVLKMKLLMYLISFVFAPTTSLRPTNRYFPILLKFLNSVHVVVFSTCAYKSEGCTNMNWCKFIVDFLYEAFANKMFQKVRLLLLMKVRQNTRCDTPPPHKFVVSAWTYDIVKVVFAVDRIRDTKYGKPWISLMAKHAIVYNVFGGPHNFGKCLDVHSAPSCSAKVRDPVEHLVSSFLHDQLAWEDGSIGDMDVGLEKDGDGDMENVQHDTNPSESREVHDGDTNDKAAQDVPASEGGHASTVTSYADVSPS